MGEAQVTFLCQLEDVTLMELSVTKLNRCEKKKKKIKKLKNYVVWYLDAAETISTLFHS